MTSNSKSDTLDFNTLSALLESFLAVQTEDMVLPKYRYPSAGSLYPVQTYVYLKRKIGDLEEGSYYYHPLKHQLIQLTLNVPLRSKIFNSESSRKAFDSDDSCQVALFLVSELKAIQPVYKELANDFSSLEGGYMTKVLMDKASSPELGLSVHQIFVDDVQFDKVKPLFMLSDSHMLVHTLLIGKQPQAQQQPTDLPKLTIAE